MKNIYDDSGNNNEPDYENNLAFPPQEEVLPMPRCDIEELKNKIKGMRIVLQDCKQMFVAEKSFLVQCSRLEDIESIIERIEGMLND